MELKPGYKQTEVGVIPEEWEVRPLLSVVRPATGQVDPRIEPYRSMILVAPDHIESKTGRLLEQKTASDQHAISGKYIFEPGDIVYSKIRPYLRKAMLAAFRGLCSADMYPLTPMQNVSSGFILAVLLGHRFSTFAESVSVRSGIPKINRDELAEYKVALPPFPEQQAIAAALSDVDSLITALDRLIAKKHNIKQGAMQELLTGKKRLPRFSGEWETRKLGEIFEISAGGDFEPSRSSAIKDEYFCYPIYSNAITDNGLYGYCSYNDHQAGSITVTARGTLGVANFRDHAFTAIGRVLVLRPKQLLDGRFFSEFINNRIDFVIENTGVPQLTAPQISKYEVLCPTFPEQQAIATILSNMDAEIAALEQKRDKTRLLKQGMMQELLTGRIRLV